jgi:hypothetical protein
MIGSVIQWEVCQAGRTRERMQMARVVEVMDRKKAEKEQQEAERARISQEQAERIKREQEEAARKGNWYKFWR